VASGSTTFVIRPETAEDHDSIRRLVAAAFGSEAEAHLVDRIRSSPEYLPELALVAVVDDEIVGHVMVSHTVVRSDVGDRRISMLSPLAVRPDHQRSGIGSALVRDAISIADGRGEPLIVLEGSPAYYGRLGFEPAERYGIRIDLPDWAPPEAAQVKRLGSFDPDDPTLRGRVIYPSAFDGVDDDPPAIP
jgi:putative acetyltransferase